MVWCDRSSRRPSGGWSPTRCGRRSRRPRIDGYGTCSRSWRPATTRSGWRPTVRGSRSPGSRGCSCAGRRVPRRFLRLLIEADHPLTVRELIEGTWPGERLTGTSGRSRVHVMISNLRKLGLRWAIASEDVDGEIRYHLNARILDPE